MRSWLRRLVDILSSLEFPPEKGRASGFRLPLPGELTWLKQSCRFAGLSARDFGEAVRHFCWSIEFLLGWIRTCSKMLWLRFRVGCLAFRQTQSPSGSVIESSSCPQSDAKILLASSYEKDRTEPLQNKQNTDAK